MKLFEKLAAWKASLHSVGMVKSFAAAWEQEEQQYQACSRQELARMGDEELFRAALARVEAKVDRCESLSAGVRRLNPAEQVF